MLKARNFEKIYGELRKEFKGKFSIEVDDITVSPDCNDVEDYFYNVIVDGSERIRLFVNIDENERYASVLLDEFCGCCGALIMHSMYEGVSNDLDNRQANLVCQAVIELAMLIADAEGYSAIYATQIASIPYWYDALKKNGKEIDKFKNYRTGNTVHAFKIVTREE